MKQTKLVCLLLLCLGLAACSEDDPKDECPDGAICTDASVAGSGGSSAGSGGSGGTGSTDDDAGVVAGSGGTGAGNGGSGGTGATVSRPPSDGSQLSVCGSGQADAGSGCAGDLLCYTAGGTSDVGYCTSDCELDADCESLGASYSCSSASGQGGTRYCRLTCSGADDTSCPEHMACEQVAGAFRCLYDEDDLGDKDTPVFGACESTGDCTGELDCYQSTSFNPGGPVYQGVCSETCEEDTDCTALPGSGNVSPSCSTSGRCVLDCSNSPGPDAATPQCPDDMACANLGAGRSRCMYLTVTGGI